MITTQSIRRFLIAFVNPDQPSLKNTVELVAQQLNVSITLFDTYHTILCKNSHKAYKNLSRTICTHSIPLEIYHNGKKLGVLLIAKANLTYIERAFLKIASFELSILLSQKFLAKSH